uniref:Uncharacterized protein n=1 Tax=Clytia hemisphaerica TaxID=252671 RepID=A0A7M6DQ56_9CNID
MLHQRLQKYDIVGRERSQTMGSSQFLGDDNSWDNDDLTRPRSRTQYGEESHIQYNYFTNSTSNLSIYDKPRYIKPLQVLDLSQQRILSHEELKSTGNKLNRTRKTSAVEKIKRKVSSANNSKTCLNVINDNCPWLGHPLNDSHVALEFPDNCTSNVEHFLKTRFCRRTAVSMESLPNIKQIASTTNFDFLTCFKIANAS